MDNATGAEWANIQQYIRDISARNVVYVTEPDVDGDPTAYVRTGLNSIIDDLPCTQRAAKFDLKAVQQRCNNITKFQSDDHYPYSYCYYTEGGKPLPDLYYPISIYFNHRKSNPVPKSYGLWSKLDQTYKEKLYILLSSVLAISNHVYFDIHTRTWIRRPEPDLQKPKLLSLIICANSDSHDDSQDILEYLAAGRSDEDMKQVLAHYQRMISTEMLHVEWVRALTSNMSNGAAQTAVHLTLSFIADLINGFEFCPPVVAVCYISSPTAAEAFSISDSSASHETSLSTSPEPKRKKISKGKSDNKGSGSGHAKKTRLYDKSDLWPNHNRKYVDLVMICEDQTSGGGKYLFLVDNKSEFSAEAKAKLIKELVHVLQMQSAVFGLLFSAQEVSLIRAERAEDKVVIVKVKDYHLTQEGDAGIHHRELDTCSFQRLLLDILACILYGFVNIDS